MSDLIDLASPDNAKVSGPKLSSPLIPLPMNDSVEPSATPVINLEGRRSMDNNPFDIELQKTNEFISKSQDPFEVVWQKAVNAGDSESHSADYKHRKNSDIMKMNKTLDDSLISAGSSTIFKNNQNNSIKANTIAKSDLNEYQLSKSLKNMESLVKPKISKSNATLPLLSVNPPSPDFHNLSILNQSIMNDSFTLCSPTRKPSQAGPLNLFTSCTLNSPNSKDLTNQHELSILNQSSMNDSLSGSNSSDNGLLKSIVARRIATCIQKGINDAESGFNIPNERYHKLRRSFSQGDRLPLKNIKQICSHSIIGGTQAQMENDCSMSSILYEDPFNRAFITRSVNENATISDISALSSIGALDSIASGVSSTEAYSIKNRGFIDESLSSTQTTFNSKQSSNRITRHSTTSSLAEISDLVAQYDRLKARTSRNSLNITCSLIDLAKENTVEQNKSQRHNITSDSVFLENEPLNQSILSDEKSLVKTFEKCSLKPRDGSNSSGENSLPKRPPSAMELLSDIELPPSDDNKIIVDNLIELQTSNSISDHTDLIESNKSQSVKINKDDDDVKTTDVIKEIEKELVEPDKKLTAATLLMELEKLVNNEQNPKAVELLGNLERVLGIKCRNNVELLEMYIQDIDTGKDVEKTSECIALSPEKSKILSVDTSEEDNINIDYNASLKQTRCENFGINNNCNINIEKTINKCEKLAKVSDCNVISPDKSTKENSTCQINQPQNLFGTQKLIVDIQIALQKFLINNNSDPTAFIENLNEVLNPSANESEVKQKNSSRISNVSPVKFIPTLPLKKSAVSQSSIKSSIIRRSVDSTSTLKKTLGLQRRSSVSQIANTSSEHNIKPKIRIDSPKKTIPRRSSSDPDSNNDVNVIKNIQLNPMKLKRSVPFVNKNKLRKNDEAEIPTKKGPLKAFIPLGNMHRRGVTGKKITPIIIPPLPPPNVSYDSSSAFMASTPNLDTPINIDCLKTSPKRKPVASSTPDIHSKLSRVKLSMPKTPKHNMSWNISPVTPTAPKIPTPTNKLFGENDSMKRLHQINKCPGVSPKSKGRSSSIRLERTPESPKKKLFSLRSHLLSQSDGKVKHGRRSEPVRNTIIAKTEVFHRTSKQKNASPLKENNTPGKKVKPVNLLSKFQRRSVNVNVEKENKWK